jgi:endonuclease/exonuclease/phosphatase family metal-dependent hydrolase
VALLVRTWNLFHGNAVPPERRGYLREMVRLVTADEPDVVCLQEVPVWALRRLAAWSGMAAAGVVAARPRLVNSALGGVITRLHHGILRSALTGQANAILVSPRLRMPEEESLVVSRRGDGERRVCQALRIADLGVVGNVHVTRAHADEQFVRAASFVRSLGPPSILCGDANIAPGESHMYEQLRAWGFSDPAPGIDQILVCGLPSTQPAIWPEERRRVDGRLLSDHAPVELYVG